MFFGSYKFLKKQNSFRIRVFGSFGGVFGVRKFHILIFQHPDLDDLTEVGVNTQSANLSGTEIKSHVKPDISETGAARCTRTTSSFTVKLKIIITSRSELLLLLLLLLPSAQLRRPPVVENSTAA